jgi:hypothetical protein
LFSFRTMLIVSLTETVSKFLNLLVPYSFWIFRCFPDGIKHALWHNLQPGLPASTGKNLTTCQQDVFATALQQACQQQVVTIRLFHQVATRLSLTTCWQIVELQDDNKLLKQLVTSLLSSTTL